MENTQHDPVNHPSYYTDGKIEVLDFIEDKKLGFHLGNAVKYICRAGKKDPAKTVEDLQKAVFYIERYIKQYQEPKADYQIIIEPISAEEIGGETIQFQDNPWGVEVTPFGNDGIINRNN